MLTNITTQLTQCANALHILQITLIYSEQFWCCYCKGGQKRTHLKLCSKSISTNGIEVSYPLLSDQDGTEH
jgi:aerobic-type carbon monoxide dehydrogenase small subunit (CoxS/CutS family)